MSAARLASPPARHHTADAEALPAAPAYAMARVAEPWRHGGTVEISEPVAADFRQPARHQHSVQAISIIPGVRPGCRRASISIHGGTTRCWRRRACTARSRTPHSATCLNSRTKSFLKHQTNRWQWMAHAVLIARHRLNDLPLALKYARPWPLTRPAPKFLTGLHKWPFLYSRTWVKQKPRKS